MEKVKDSDKQGGSQSFAASESRSIEGDDFSSKDSDGANEVPCLITWRDFRLI